MRRIREAQLSICAGSEAYRGGRGLRSPERFAAGNPGAPFTGTLVNRGPGVKGLDAGLATWLAWRSGLDFSWAKKEVQSPRRPAAPTCCTREAHTGGELTTFGERLVYGEASF